VKIAQGPLRPDARQEQQIEVFHDNCTSTAFTFEPMHGRIPGDCASDLLRYRLCRCAQGRGCQLWLMGNQYHLGIGVSMAIYLSAGISGAHLNPAVSIALCLFADFDKRKLPFYILAQVAGAFCSAAWCTRSTATCFSITNKPTIWCAAPRPAWNWPRYSRLIPCTAEHGPGLPGGNGHHRDPDGRDHGPDRR